MSGYKILAISDVLSKSDRYAGRHRIEGLCKYWARLGCEVHILTRGPTVPRHVAGCTYHFTSKGADRWRRLPYLNLWRQRISARVLIPDEAIFWYPRACQKATDIIRSAKGFDLVFSSFASATSHLVASSVSRKFRIPWIADYRDIWTDNVYHHGVIPLYLLGGRQQPKVMWRINAAIERRALDQALLVTTISEAMAGILKQKVADSTPVYTIPNGYDDDLVATDQQTWDEFRIGYTGRLHNSRDYKELNHFLEALRELRKEHSIVEDKLRFCYWGEQASIVRRLADEKDLGSVVEAHDPCSYQSSVLNQRQSTVLILMLPLSDRRSLGVSSRKLFDYLAARRPIIGVVPRSSAAAQVILETRAGQIAGAKGELKTVIWSYLSEFLATGSVAFAGREDTLKGYAFSRLAAKVLDCFEQSSRDVPSTSA